MAFAWSLYNILLAVLISAKEANTEVKLHVRDWRDVKNDVLCMIHWRNGRKQSKQKRQTRTKRKGAKPRTKSQKQKPQRKSTTNTQNKKPSVECIETSTAHRSEEVWRWQLVYHLPCRPSTGNQKEQQKEKPKQEKHNTAINNKWQSRTQTQKNQRSSFTHNKKRGALVHQEDVDETSSQPCS